MKILVTGGRGQLGRSVARRGRERGHEVIAPDVDELDICGPLELPGGLGLVINAAAYTAVDKAESERDAAFAINHDGAANVARACRERGVPLVHVSTDYVFAGDASRPYREDDAIAPLGVYGESKAAGESAVLELGACVVRTSWLFAEGGPSFVHTILRLARERPVLRVVADQHGCPTYAGDLADALIELGERGHVRARALYHYCNDGATTWHAFAGSVVDEARARTPLACERIEAITTAEYPTPAKRPAYSVLDTARVHALGIATLPWRPGLARVVADALSKG